MKVLQVKQPCWAHGCRHAEGLEELVRKERWGGRAPVVASGASAVLRERWGEGAVGSWRSSRSSRVELSQLLVHRKSPEIHRSSDF